MTMAREKQKGGPRAQTGECREQKAWPLTSAASGISLHLPALQMPSPHSPAAPAPLLLRSPGGLEGEGGG